MRNRRQTPLPRAQPVHQASCGRQLLCRRSQNTAQRQIPGLRLVAICSTGLKMGAPLAVSSAPHQGQGDQIGHVKPSQAHQPQHPKVCLLRSRSSPGPLRAGAPGSGCGRKAAPWLARAAITNSRRCMPARAPSAPPGQDGILYRHLEDHQCCQGPAHPGKSPPCLPGLLIPLEKPISPPYAPPPDSLRLERVGAQARVNSVYRMALRSTSSWSLAIKSPQLMAPRSSRLR